MQKLNHFGFYLLLYKAVHDNIGKKCVEKNVLKKNVLNNNVLKNIEKQFSTTFLLLRRAKNCDAGPLF